MKICSLTQTFAQKSVAIGRNVFPRGVRVGVHVIWALCSDPNLSISSLCRHGVHCCTAGQRGSALMGVAVEFLRLVTRDLPLARWLRTCVRYKRGERGWTSTFRSSLVNRYATSLPFAISLFLPSLCSMEYCRRLTIVIFFNIFIAYRSSLIKSSFGSYRDWDNQINGIYIIHMSK